MVGLALSSPILQAGERKGCCEVAAYLEGDCDAEMVVGSFVARCMVLKCCLESG